MRVGRKKGLKLFKTFRSFLKTLKAPRTHLTCFVLANPFVLLVWGERKFPTATTCGSEGNLLSAKIGAHHGSQRTFPFVSVFENVSTLLVIARLTAMTGTFGYLANASDDAQIARRLLGYRGPSKLRILYSELSPVSNRKRQLLVFGSLHPDNNKNSNKTVFSLSLFTC